MAAKKEKDLRDREFLAKRRAGFTAVLKKLGAEKEFGRLPQAFRNRMYIHRIRAPYVQLDPSIASQSAALSLKRELDDLLDRPLVDVMGNGQLLSFREVWWVVVTIYASLRHQTTGQFAAVARAMGPICTEKVHDIIHRVGYEVEMLAMFASMQHSRLDHQFYGAEIRQAPADSDQTGKHVFVFGAQPRKRMFARNGPPRAAYQMGICAPRGACLWAEWDPVTVGRASGPKLPVYVQLHTLQRLMERCPGERNESKRGGLHMLLCDALVHPEITQREGETLWIALRDFQHDRLGYLLAEVVDGSVLVRTYQFLTMNGSPEAKRLYRRLGARRGDFEHLKLDQLSTYVETDLADDSELRAIFAECGCGHLFDLRRKWEWPEVTDHRTADWVRGYLELGPSPKNTARTLPDVDER